MKFNVNDYVKVKLTDRGKEILFEQFQERHSQRPDVFRKFHLPEENAEGWSSWQLWSLMSTFGNYIRLGCETPFETEIEIVE